MVSTLYLSRQGYCELNPIMSRLLAYPFLFVLTKVAAMTWLCIFLFNHRDDRHAIPLATLAASVYSLISMYYVAWFILL